MALIVGLPTLAPRGRVDRLRVTNPLPWHVDVRADGPDVDGAVAVGTVSRGQTGDFHGLPDVGRTWVFRFRYAGVDAGELSVSREQLDQDGWEVTVPAEAGEHLRTAGMPRVGRLSRPGHSGHYPPRPAKRGRS